MLDFNSVYQEKIIPAIEPLEIDRKCVMRLYIISYLIVALAAGGFYIATQKIEVAIMSVATMSWVITRITRSKLKSFRGNFKSNIIQSIVTSYNPDWEYSPQSGIHQDVFKDSRIFLTKIDRYHSEDLIDGGLGDTDFHFSEVHAESAGSDNGSNYNTIFKGIFFRADFNKHFNGTTVVLPDMAEKAFGFLGKFLQKHNFRKEDLVNMEDPVFEKAFVVYGTDQVEARYILSPALMKRFTDFKNALGSKFYASFDGFHINIALPFKKDFFEPAIWSTLYQPARYKEFFTELDFFTSIVEEMNLNTRIWTKD